MQGQQPSLSLFVQFAAERAYERLASPATETQLSLELMAIFEITPPQ